MQRFPRCGVSELLTRQYVTLTGLQNGDFPDLLSSRDKAHR